MTEESRSKSRSKTIIKTSILGIVANVLLASFKATIGFFTHSIAIIMDGVNNLTDAASSIVTIIGTRLAEKKPDKKHPFGHGRVEYLSAMIVAVIVLYAGITSLIESIKKIINPMEPDYSPLPLVIVAVAVVVKIALGIYVKKVGERVNSDSLINSGEDAKLDAIISASTIVAAIVFIYSGLSLEAWLGAIISLIIIKAGIDMLRETVSRLLGEPAGQELADKILGTVISFPDVEGAYDLVLNNYGPDTYNGSIHIEVPDTYSADELDDLIRRITMEVYEKFGVVLTAVGVYSLNTKNPKAKEMRSRIMDLALAHKHIKQVHGFNLNEEKKIIRFDLVISFDAGDREELFNEVVEEVRREYPEYMIEAIMDTEFTELR